MSAFDGPEFSDSYPVSFLLREAHPETWFRIHSLPESKRYPETEAEWEILIDRHRRLSDEVLQPGAACRIHYSLFADERFPGELEPSLQWEKTAENLAGANQEIFTRAARAPWDFDSFLPWIRLRSDDQLGWISFHSLETDAIYAPYDGGADVFSTDEAFLSGLKDSFAAWKSKHPKGL